jgi:bifunctional UDP-N-acetylglucosamine pyrophosphorylase/glucosamine-1-phosphate N-acetyltransferase
VALSDVAAIVLAAGEGKRLRSTLPKVLHLAAGRPLLAHALLAVEDAGISTRVVVVSNRRAEIEAAMNEAHPFEGLVYAVQDPPNGTGDAVRVGMEALPEGSDTVLVALGDAPLVKPETIERLVELHRSTGAAGTLLTADAPPNNDGGRVIRRADGSVDRIVEARDATPEELTVAEINSGLCIFEKSALVEMLNRITPANSQGEYYLTDVFALLRAEGRSVQALKGSFDEIRGVNDRIQLAEAGASLRLRTAERWMAEGVTIIDPQSTFIDATVTLAPDAVILPGTFLEGTTTVAAGAEVGPQTRIVDSTIGAGAVVTFSVVKGSEIGDEASVGPFASLRPGTRLARGSKLGTFVESKNLELGEGSKANHLAYLGDARIGRGVNVGAGTITCNWDGTDKHMTVIDDDAYISSDTMLVAPVRIGERAATGAGSVVRDDVPADGLAVGVPARVIEGKGNRMKKKDDKKQ